MVKEGLKKQLDIWSPVRDYPREMVIATHDHQVHVEEKLARRARGWILSPNVIGGTNDPVHHIDMQPIGAAVFDCEAHPKIFPDRLQNGWGDNYRGSWS